MRAFMSRRAGKSAVFAAMYGTGAAAYGGKLHENMAQMRRAEHPFQYHSGYTYVAHDKRFGSVPVYKVTTKTVSEIMRKDRVPHTEVYCRDADELASVIDAKVVVLAWIRRTNHEDLRTAVATMLMLGKEPVIVRAFEP